MGGRWSPGEPTGLGAALWRMGSHSARGRMIGRPFGKRLPILPVSRSPLGEVEEDPPTFQQVSMFGPWLLVQRRRLEAERRPVRGREGDGTRARTWGAPSVGD